MAMATTMMTTVRYDLQSPGHPAKIRQLTDLCAAEFMSHGGTNLQYWFLAVVLLRAIAAAAVWRNGRLLEIVMKLQ